MGPVIRVGVVVFFFKQKTAYEIGWCDWSSDVCSSDLRLMPREEAFTPLFCEQTRCIVEAARELLDMLEGRGAHEAHVAAIRAIEHEADGAARKVFLAANRTFNAPIDREDIVELANRLDDAVDMIEDTA